MPRKTNIQTRKGTAASWASSNPVLAAGEPGFETDTKKLKIGDGTTAWNSLPYFTVDGGVIGGGSPTPTPTPTAVYFRMNPPTDKNISW